MPREKQASGNYRYPGVTPFTTEQRDIFFGRRRDTGDLYRLLRREQLVVLYGKSGLGKSSLFNAGIIPLCREKGKYNPVSIRFGAWIEGSRKTPLDAAKEVLSSLDAAPTFLDTLLPDDHSLWYYVKSRQLRTLDGPDQALLLFDQFEELFSYPEEQVTAFQKELSELLHTRVPLRYQRMADSSESLSDEEGDRLEAALDTRIVFAIRSDRMHLLDRLKDYLPTVMRHTFELKALSPADAEEAIIEPARATGPFKTRPFAYTPEALAALMDYLKEKKDKEERVEGILLQMLCEHYERKQVEKEGLEKLDKQHIGDPEQVVKKYYEEKIQQLPAEQQGPARRLIEDGLVSEGEAMRLTLHESFILKEFEVDKALLDQLVDSRLLRSEPFLRGGYTYELSHDRLVSPVLNSRSLRREAFLQEEAKIQREVIAAEKAEADRRRRRALLTSFVAMALILAALVASFFAYRQNQKAEQASIQAVSALLTQSRQDILQLQYDQAFAKLKNAANLGVFEDSLSFELMEIAFFRYHSGSTQLAQESFDLATELLKNPKLAGKMNFEQLDRNRAQFINRRYFPVLQSLPGGTFSMGRDSSREDGNKNELPRNQVELSPFGLAQTETTFWQWNLYIAAKGRDIQDYSPSWGTLGDHPAVNLDWFDACEYANWLSDLEGKQPYYAIDSIGKESRYEWEVTLLTDGSGYRLPTEAEWEYAARGGSDAPYYKFAGSDSLDLVGWYRDNSIVEGVRSTQPVGSKIPLVLSNGNIFYDLSGNVREWCWDWYGNEYYVECNNRGVVKNPPGPKDGSDRVFRGGGWFSFAQYCRVSFRFSFHPVGRSTDIGFRLAHSL